MENNYYFHSYQMQIKRGIRITKHDSTTSPIYITDLTDMSKVTITFNDNYLTPLECALEYLLELGIEVDDVIYTDTYQIVTTRNQDIVIS